MLTICLGHYILQFTVFTVIKFNNYLLHLVCIFISMQNNMELHAIVTFLNKYIGDDNQLIKCTRILKKKSKIMIVRTS